MRKAGPSTASSEVEPSRWRWRRRTRCWSAGRRPGRRRRRFRGYSRGPRPRPRCRCRCQAPSGRCSWAAWGGRASRRQRRALEKGSASASGGSCRSWSGEGGAGSRRGRGSGRWRASWVGQRGPLRVRIAGWVEVYSRMRMGLTMARSVATSSCTRRTSVIIRLMSATIGSDSLHFVAALGSVEAGGQVDERGSEGGAAIAVG